jgi:hypothetical protein
MACLWKKGAGTPLAEVFPRYGTCAWIPSPGPLDRAAGSRKGRRRLGKPRAAPGSVGYHPPVCSNVGDAIDRVRDAIDQLARDAHGDLSEPELAARVAALWQLISQLDPELARRTQGYAEQPGGPLPD